MSTGESLQEPFRHFVCPARNGCFTLWRLPQGMQRGGEVAAFQRRARHFAASSVALQPFGQCGRLRPVGAESPALTEWLQ